MFEPLTLALRTEGPVSHLVYPHNYAYQSENFAVAIFLYEIV